MLFLQWRIPQNHPKSKKKFVEIKPLVGDTSKETLISKNHWYFGGYLNNQQNQTTGFGDVCWDLNAVVQLTSHLYRHDLLQHCLDRQRIDWLEDFRATDLAVIGDHLHFGLHLQATWPFRLLISGTPDTWPPIWNIQTTWSLGPFMGCLIWR